MLERNKPGRRVLIKIKMRQNIKSWIKVGAYLISVAGAISFFPLRQSYIGSRLEKDAILCSTTDNILIINGINQPLLRNKDLDNDGKYESAVFYKQNGKIIYQEVKRKDGKLIFEEPRIFR